MRVNFIQLDLTDGDQHWRYRDVLEHPNTSIKGPEALEDDYYNWIKEKDFAWFINDDNIFVIAFYENHPFFNCLLLRYGSELLDDVGWDMVYSPASEVVEPWFKRVYTNYKRRQKRKTGSNVKI